ncbi:membrane transport protein-domain-containing protein [Geranomyces variabilis]|nr:membrane transport protein-domain-containing protein [Geranomyces variabilis]
MLHPQPDQPDHPPHTSSPLVLALAALQSLAAVAFVVAAGWIYALKGNFPLSMQRDLARMVVQLLAPCLLLVSIAHTVNAEEFYLWWPIPFLFVLYTVIAYGAAVVISFGLGIPRPRARFIASAAMMGNCNSLPVALIHSLSRDSGSRLVMDPLGDAAHVARRGIAFVLFYSLFSNILRWTVCYQLMARDPADELPTIQYDGAAAHEAISVPGYHAHATPKVEDMFPGDALVADVPCADRNTYRNKCRRRSILFMGSQDGLSDDGDVTTSSPRSVEGSPSPLSRPSERTPLLLPDNDHQPRVTESPSLLPALEPPALPPPRSSRAEHWRHVRDTVLEIMNAPLYAAILALFIGLIPPLKNLFFSNGGKDAGSALFEEIVTDPLYSLGEASVPIIILTLGGQLGSMGKRSEGGSTSASTEPFDVLVVIFIRMLLIPAIAGPTLYAMASHVPLARDKTFVAAMMLLAACPPALNLMNMSQAQRNHESITARLLFWAYLVSIPLLTGWVVLDLLLLENSWPSRIS